MVQGAALRDSGETHQQMAIFKLDGDNARLVSEFADALKEALRNHLDQKSSDRLGTQLDSMLAKKEKMVIFEDFERELGRNAIAFGIREDEREALRTYLKSSRPEDRVKSVYELHRDVERSYAALGKVDGEISKVKPEHLSRIISLAEKRNLKREDVQSMLGKSPELADALILIMSKQEASAIAARNIVDLDRNEYSKLFNIDAKNEAMCALKLYRRILGDAKFRKAMDAISRGNVDKALAEIRKLSMASQYIVYALLMPALIRAGMWSTGALGVIGKVLGKIKELALRAKRNPASEQARYVRGAARFADRFGDFKGMNFAMFSAAFISCIK